MVDLGAMGWRLGLPMCKVKSDRHGSKGQWVRAGAGEGLCIGYLVLDSWTGRACLLPVVCKTWMAAMPHTHTYVVMIQESTGTVVRRKCLLVAIRSGFRDCLLCDDQPISTCEVDI